MTVYSIGDQARAFAMRTSSHRIKMTVDTLTSELSKGEVEDVAARLRGNTQGLSNIESRLKVISQLKDNAAEAAFTLQTVQDALGAIQARSGALGGELVAFASSTPPYSLAVRAAESAQAFEATVSHLNTSAGGRFPFAGTNSDTAPLIPAGQILEILETLVAGMTSASDVTTAVTAWFDVPAGFYNGSIGEDQRIPVGERTSVTLAITAITPALRDELKALAVAALVDRGVLSGDPGGQAALLQYAGEALINNQASLVSEMARIGIDQQTVERAQSEGSAAAAALTISRNEIRHADPYETAAALSEAEAQLEMLYTVTARLSRLKLVDFLS